PFQIVYGSSPRTAPELRKIEQGERTSAEAEEFAEHIKRLHEEVQAHITKMNQEYKARADRSRVLCYCSSIEEVETLFDA
ncbi:hypothetical protein P3S38_29405, partial [Enterobacter hormaechei]|uniref:hypothetical protein n=1 Tax=Enterobacter hormaechei TaxID=158836 RepID=UPI0023E3F764